MKTTSRAWGSSDSGGTTFPPEVRTSCRVRMRVEIRSCPKSELAPVSGVQVPICRPDRVGARAARCRPHVVLGTTKGPLTCGVLPKSTAKPRALARALVRPGTHADERNAR